MAPRRKKTQPPEDALPYTEPEVDQGAAPAPPTPDLAASSAESQPVNCEASTTDLNVDDILRRLEDVVRELESGELSLERALKRFEDGVKFARQGSAVLDKVEQRVEILLSDQEQPVPFAAQDDSNT